MGRMIPQHFKILWGFWSKEGDFAKLPCKVTFFPTGVRNYKTRGMLRKVPELCTTIPLLTMQTLLYSKFIFMLKCNSTTTTVYTSLLATQTFVIPVALTKEENFD